MRKIWFVHASPWSTRENVLDIVFTKCDMLYYPPFSVVLVLTFCLLSLVFTACRYHPGRWRMTTPWGSKTRGLARCCCLPMWQRNTLATTPALPQIVWGLPMPAFCCFVSKHNRSAKTPKEDNDTCTNTRRHRQRSTLRFNSCKSQCGSSRGSSPLNDTCALTHFSPHAQHLTSAVCSAQHFLNHLTLPSPHFLSSLPH